MKTLFTLIILFLTLNSSAQKGLIVLKWTQSAIGVTMPAIDTSKINNAKFPLFFYEKPFKFPPSKNDLYYKVVRNMETEVRLEKNNIFINYGDEDGRIWVQICQRMVIRNYHLSMGSNGGCSMYSFIDKKFLEFPFTVVKVNDYTLDIEQDGYDNLGHYFKKGTYNLTDSSVHWKSTQH